MVGDDFKTETRTCVTEFDDKRVIACRLDDGGYGLKWERKADLPSLAIYQTRVGLSPESFVATLKNGIALWLSFDLPLEQILPKDVTVPSEIPSDEDYDDAELYRVFRHAFATRRADLLAALNSCITDDDIDRVIRNHSD